MGTLWREGGLPNAFYLKNINPITSANSLRHLRTVFEPLACEEACPMEAYASHSRLTSSIDKLLTGYKFFSVSTLGIFPIGEG